MELREGGRETGMDNGDVGTQRGRKTPSDPGERKRRHRLRRKERGDEKTEMASPYSVGFERWRWEEDALLLSARNRAPLGLIEKENDGSYQRTPTVSRISAPSSNSLGSRFSFSV